MSLSFSNLKPEASLLITSLSVQVNTFLNKLGRPNEFIFD